MEKVTIGHENTGTVAAIGKNVTGFKVGDPVGCLGCSYACCMSSSSRFWHTDLHDRHRMKLTFT